MRNKMFLMDIAYSQNRFDRLKIAKKKIIISIRILIKFISLLIRFKRYPNMESEW